MVITSGAGGTYQPNNYDKKSRIENIQNQILSKMEGRYVGGYIPTSGSIIAGPKSFRQPINYAALARTRSIHNINNSRTVDPVGDNLKSKRKKSKRVWNDDMVRRNNAKVVEPKERKISKDMKRPSKVGVEGFGGLAGLGNLLNFR